MEKINTLRVKNMSFENNSQQVEILDAKVENNSNDIKFRYVDAHPFVPDNDDKRRERCREIFSIQAGALAKRLEHVGSTGAVVGISGGLDSTLALLVCTKAMSLLGKENSDILGVTMPGFGTTGRTYNNALKLMNCLGVTVRKVDIKEACMLHMRDIEHDADIHDITYENTQARERTQVLFDLANKHGKLLVGTGDLSELAMGWCTYNGDHMSMYGVNASVPKTLVRYLVDYVASVSEKILRTCFMIYLILPFHPNFFLLMKTEILLRKRKKISALTSFMISFFTILSDLAFQKKNLSALRLKHLIINILRIRLKSGRMYL